MNIVVRVTTVEFKVLKGLQVKEKRCKKGLEDMVKTALILNCQGVENPCENRLRAGWRFNNLFYSLYSCSYVKW